MAITLEGWSKGTYPFRVFHTSLRSTYRQKMGPKYLNTWGTWLVRDMFQIELDELYRMV
jgi:hypothetical protein